MLATSTQPNPTTGQRGALACSETPVGYSDPSDVLKDLLLDRAKKRAILASWASDASAVEDRPDLRWLSGTEKPVPLDDILAALARLDRLESM